MIIETSAIVAIAFREPERETFIRTILSTDVRMMSVSNLLEATSVIEGRRGTLAGRVLDELLARLNIELIPITVDQAQEARQAWRRYGKKRHPANLNFGDCFSYALAKTMDEPLLFKGKDFAQTDVQSAL